MSHISNQYFSVTTGMTYPIKSSIENFLFAKDNWCNSFFVFIHAADPWLSKFSKKNAIHNDINGHSIFYFSATTNSISTLKISIENQKPSTCRQVLNLKKSLFILLHQNPDSPKSPYKNFSMLIFLDFRSHISTKLQVCSVPSGSASKTS